MGRINGVVDDRGKYIYITAAEMGRVTEFIKKQGRVNMAALAKESNKLINLNSSADAATEGMKLDDQDLFDAAEKTSEGAAAK